MEKLCSREKQQRGKIRSVAGPKNREQPDIRLGISTCLLGERLRYDGGHNRHRLPEWVHQQVYLHPYPKPLPR